MAPFPSPDDGILNLESGAARIVVLKVALGTVAPTLEPRETEVNSRTSTIARYLAYIL